MKHVANIFFFSLLLSIGSIGIPLVSEARGQTATGKPRDWPDPIRWVVDDEASLLKAEAAMRDLLARSDRTEEMGCAWALIGVARNDVVHVRTAVNGIRKSFPTATPSTLRFCDRMDLWLALGADAPSGSQSADALFRKLALVIHRSDADSLEQQAIATELGSICRLLEERQARSPISDDHLEKCREILEASSDRKVTARFKESRDQTSASADFLAFSLNRIATDGQSFISHRMSELETQLHADKSALGSAVKSHNAIKDEVQKNQEDREPVLRDLQRYISSIRAEEALATLGYPGSEPREPKEPKGDDDQDWREYRRDEREYPARLRRWKEATKQWKAADSARRGDIAQRRKVLESQQAAVRVDVASDKQRSNEAQKRIFDLEESIVDRTRKIALLKAAGEAYDAGKPELVFRTPHHSLIDLSIERSLLLQFAKNRSKASR